MAHRGRRTAIPQNVRDLMVSLREEGWSLPRIARELNARGIPTPGGGIAWYPQSVRQAVLAEQHRRGAPPHAQPEGPRITVAVSDLDESEVARLAILIWMATAMTGSGRSSVHPDGVPLDTLAAVWPGRPRWV